MALHFKSVRPTNLSSDGSTAGLGIYFERADSPPASDPNVENLRDNYEETMFVLQSMQLSDDTFANLFNPLIEGAKVGLEGNINDSSIKAGSNELNKVRRSMVDLATKERDKYLNRLATLGAIVSAVSLVLAGVVASVPYFISNTTAKSLYVTKIDVWLLPACLLHPGVCLGVVFIGFILNRSFTFDKISKFDSYAFTPKMRILFISLVSYALLAALWFKVIMLGAGSYLLNDVTTKPAAGFLIGLVCGVSEPVVVELLLSRLKPVERNRGEPNIAVTRGNLTY